MIALFISGADGVSFMAGNVNFISLKLSSVALVTTVSSYGCLTRSVYTVYSKKITTKIEVSNKRNIASQFNIRTVATSQ